MTLPPETVIINRWESSCNNCGKGVDPHTRKHDEVIGYSMLSEPGCGIEFKYAASDYIGQGFKKGIMEQQFPHLEWIDRWGAENE